MNKAYQLMAEKKHRKCCNCGAPVGFIAYISKDEDVYCSESCYLLGEGYGEKMVQECQP